MTCWAILKLEPTDNTRDIKRAYSTLLKGIDPEQDPESFQRLNQAYKSALESARLDRFIFPTADASSINFESVPEINLPSVNQSANNDQSSDFTPLSNSTLREINANKKVAGYENEQTLLNEIDSRKQQQRAMQKESKQQIESFHEALRNIMQTPNLRDSESAWQTFLDRPELDSFEFREKTSIPVFAAFAEHFKESAVNLDGAYIPQTILQELCERYAWDNYELGLTNYFSSTEISRVLSYAYNSHNSSNNAESAGKKVNIGKLFLIMIAVIVLLALIFNGLVKSSKTTTSAEATASLAQVNWDERLLSCNNVFNAQPNDDFNVCLEQAKAGNINALKRISWAYSRSGEHLNWRQVFDGLKVLSRTDRDAQLLLFALMKFISKDEKIELQGETGIKRLANRNFAPANILLATLYVLKENKLDQTSNVLWLLERAYETDPDSLTPIDLAIIYANGLVSEKDVLKARELLSRAAEAYYPNGTNNVAWFLATLDYNPFAEPELALSLAQKVVDHPTHGQRHTYVDTLAASYAAAGLFEEAAQTQQQAINLIDSLGWEQSRKDKEISDFKERLSLYKNEQALVFFTFEVEKQPFFITIREKLVNRLLNKLFVTITAPPIASKTAPQESQ